MSGLVIFFAVVRCGGTVRVRSLFVEFGSSLVRISWHSILGSRFRLLIRHSLYFLHCSIVNTSPQLASNCSSRAIGNGLGDRQLRVGIDFALAMR